jgi:hypothetical protein
MYHYVTYNLKTGEITGHFISSTTRVLPTPRSPGDANLMVTNPHHLQALRAAVSPLHNGSGGRMVSGRVAANEIAELTAKPLFDGKIRLSTNVKRHNTVGHSEIPADGESLIRITATLQDNEGKALGHGHQKGRRPKMPPTIAFRTDRGALSRRTVDVVDGVADVELRSVAETVSARVTAFAEGFQPANLNVEFIPPDEFEASEQGHAKRKR